MVHVDAKLNISPLTICISKLKCAYSASNQNIPFEAEAEIWRSKKMEKKLNKSTHIHTY